MGQPDRELLAIGWVILIVFIVLAVGKLING